MVALDRQFHHKGTKAPSGGTGIPTGEISYIYYNSNWQAIETRPNGTTDYIWQGWQTMEDRNPFGGSGSTDTPIRQYVWGTYIDECIQLNLLESAGPQSVPVGAYYLLQDLLYRAVALTNSSGQIVEAYDNDAYGSTLIFTAPGPDGIWFTDDDVQSSYGANEIIYCGYRYDAETQLYYVRNRTYNPALGRWIQRDPIGYDGGLNLYGYVYGLVCIMLDPSGLGAEPMPDPGPGPGPYTGPNPIGRIGPEPVPIGIGTGIIEGAGAVVAAGLAIWVWAGKITTRAENEFSADTAAANALAVTIGNWNRQAASLRRKRPCVKNPCQNHHIATDKHDTVWTPVFHRQFKRAGMELSGKANICRICGLGDNRKHAGPHPEAYHRWIEGQILQCVGRPQAKIWSEAQMGQCLQSLLNLICEQLNTVGNAMRGLVTKVIEK